MPYEPAKHHRKSIRLEDYDYAQEGAYFITIVTQDCACLFGNISDGQIELSPAGQMVEKWWQELEQKYPDIQAGEHVVMPNHIHGIIRIKGEPVGADLRVRPLASDHDTRPPVTDLCVRPPASDHDTRPPVTDLCVRPPASDQDTRPPVGADLCVRPPAADLRVHPDRVSLPVILQWFKTMTTNEYIREVKQSGWTPFHGKLWQRNYYEHILRNAVEYADVVQYIETNPLNWTIDHEYPA